jgi:hypothetical protein
MHCLGVCVCLWLICHIVCADSCRVIGQEIAALPGNATIGFIKVSAKPLKASLATWASKWVYLFTHYLQVSRGAVLLSVGGVFGTHMPRQQPACR